jgi:uncharacterized protein (DUF4415 family)
MTGRPENIVRVSAAEAKSMKGETDWARLDAMTDEDIARAVADDPDAAPLDIDWDKASLVIPHTAKNVITLRVDADVLAWLRSTGPGYQTRINQALRTWYERSVKREMAISAGIKVRKPGKLKPPVSATAKAAAKKAARKTRRAKPMPTRKRA